MDLPSCLDTQAVSNLRSKNQLIDYVHHLDKD